MSGPAPSIQYAWDGPGTLGAPDAGLFMRWNNTTARFEMASVTVPSTLDDLSDVTVTGAAQGAVLYRNASGWVHLPAGSNGQALLSGGAGANPAWGAAGVSDHGGLTGLSDDDHSIYALLAPGTSTRNVIQPTGDFAALILRAFVSQTAAPFVLQDSTPSAKFYIGANFDPYSNAGYRFRSATTHGMFSNSGLIRLGADGSFYAIDISPAGTPGVLINTRTASAVACAIKLAAAQTANAFEVNTSAGSGGDVLRVTAAGELRSVGRIVAPGSVGGGNGLCVGVNNFVGFYSAWDGTQDVLSARVANTRTIWSGKEISSAPAIGFLGATPVVRAAHIADPSGGGTQDAEARTAINAILVALETYGLLATS